MEPPKIDKLELVDGGIVLCYSGGIDSFIGAQYLAVSQLWTRKLHVVYFNLGSKYSAKELKYAREIIASGEDVISVDDSLAWLGRFEVGDKAFVPYRNLFLAMTASAKYAPNVCICGLKDDVVADKNREVFEEWSKHLTKIGDRKVKIFSPFWDMTKDDIVAWYLNSGADPEHLVRTVSCYSSEDTSYCGTCNCCFRKWVVLRNNGFDIPFYNKVMIQQYEAACAGTKYDEHRREITLKVINEYRRLNAPRETSERTG